MKVVLQRVEEARILIDNALEKSIGKGLFLLVGVTDSDTEEDALLLAKKCAELRIFDDEEGRLNLSANDLGADALVVSNFTLYADLRKGRRPSFVKAARPPFAEELYEAFLSAVKQQGFARVESGKFGAYMQITSVADGPVTLLLDTADWHQSL